MLSLMPTRTAAAFRIFLPVSAVMVAASGSSGVRPGGQAAAPPQGQSGRVSIDFLALTEDEGRPVPDLTAGEITLKVDGRAREVRSLRFVRLATPAERARGSFETDPPPPYGSNLPHDAGRLVLLVIDRESIRATREDPVRAAVDTLMDRLAPNDRLGLVTLPYGGTEVDLTRDRSRLLEALAALRGQAPATPTDLDAACHTRVTLSSLADLLQGLAPLHGPKTIVFVSSGLSPPRADAARLGRTAPCDVRVEDYQEVEGAASDARAHIYIIQPDAPIVADASGRLVDRTAEEFAGLNSLAGVTGGQVFRLAGRGDEAFRRIGRETSGYYLLDFDVGPSEQNGVSRRLEIGVSRRGVSIRARPRFVIPRPDPLPRRVLTPQEIVRDTRHYHDLPIRVIAYPSRNPGDSRIKIVAVAEPSDPSVVLKGAAFGLIDGRGRLVGRTTLSSVELASRPLLAAFVARPGAYRLRVAATDGSRYGAADYEFLADMTVVGPLTASSLVLGAGDEERFAQRMLFTDEPAAMAYLEVYGEPKGVAVSVIFEVAATSDGPALAAGLGRAGNARDEDRWIVTGTFPIAGLAPGDYVVRAIIRLNGQPTARVFRTLRKAE